MAAKKQPAKKAKRKARIVGVQFDRYPTPDSYRTLYVKNKTESFYRDRGYTPFREVLPPHPHAEGGGAVSACRATIELLNGEYVSPCHKPAGHEGEHEGYCLGGRAVWTGGQHTDEEEEMMEDRRTQRQERRDE